MIQLLRRHGHRQLYIHLYGMALVRPDQGLVLIERIALLTVRPDDLLQGLHVKGPFLLDAPYQVLHICPAMFIQCDPHRLRLMP